MCPLESTFVVASHAAVLEGRGDSLYRRVVLDSIYQIVVHSGIFALELLITATVLALVPYMVLRDLVSRIARLVGVGKPADRSIRNDDETQT